MIRIAIKCKNVIRARTEDNTRPADRLTRHVVLLPLVVAKTKADKPRRHLLLQTSNRVI
jgi:hypothetical protein